MSVSGVYDTTGLATCRNTATNTKGVNLDKPIPLQKLRISQGHDVFSNRGAYEQVSFNSCAYVTYPRFGRLRRPRIYGNMRGARGHGVRLDGEFPAELYPGQASREALLRSEERFRLLVEGVRDYAASALANGTPSGSDRGGGQRR